MNIRSCRVCDCMDFNACIEPDGFPCCWVEDDHCSACAFFAQGDRVVLLEEAEDISRKEATAPASTRIIKPRSLHEHERQTNTSTGAS